MATLKKNDIIEVLDIASETLPVPEWGGDVKLRALSGADRAAIVGAYDPESPESGGMFDLYVVAASMVDDDGNRMFSMKEVGVLAKKSAKALMRVAAAARRLSGLDGSAIEDAEKN